MKQKSILSLIALLCCLGSMKAQTFTPTRKVVFEDQTQCSPFFGQYCPRGIVRIDSFANSAFSNTVEIISVHSNTGGPPDDLMTDSAYSNGSQSNSHLPVIVWPSISFDRKVSNIEPDSVFIYYNQHVGDFGVADVGINLVYNTTTRALDVTANTHFAIDAIHYNLALVLTEDSVHGTTINYSQRNNYAAGALGPMAGGGIDFAAQPDPVPAALMYYRHVARAILPSFAGANGSLPDTAYADSSYSYTFPTYIIPAGYNASKMRAIILLIDTASGQIKNANGSNLVNTITGISEVINGVPTCSVFPNPFVNELKIYSTKENGEVALYDLMGKEILRQRTFTGETKINTVNISAGYYLLNYNDGNKTANIKLVKF